MNETIKNAKDATMQVAKASVPIWLMIVVCISQIASGSCGSGFASRYASLPEVVEELQEDIKKCETSSGHHADVDSIKVEVKKMNSLLIRLCVKLGVEPTE